MFASENIVLQNALKAFRGNKAAPAGFKVKYDSGVDTEIWHDEAGKNPRPIKIFNQPRYDVIGADDEIIFSISAGHNDANRIYFSSMWDGDAETVKSWDEAILCGFKNSVLANYAAEPSKSPSLSDAVNSLAARSTPKELKV
ncbi:MAG: hypothetical protein M1300_08830 [Epsilonproteobacteria bacterium]|nr:hypothetical protein [Campylobacterota bacterium]